MILTDAAFQWKKRGVSFLINNKTENGNIRMEGQLYPAAELGIARTVLANERTLLALFELPWGVF